MWLNYNKETYKRAIELLTILPTLRQLQDNNVDSTKYIEIINTVLIAIKYD